MPKILTFDLGTTLFKLAVFDLRGNLLGLRRVHPPIEHPRAGTWEMAVESFFSCLRGGIRELRTQFDLSDVSAISFASQANSFTLLDAADRPLCPLILWPDDRAIGQTAAMQRAAGRAALRQQTGIPRMSHQFAAAKLLQLRGETPSLFRDRPRLMFISDLLTWWLTRQHVCEGGIAGLSGAADIHALRWRDEALEELGFGSLRLPTITRAGRDVGAIDPAAADELSLPRACRFVVGSLDQYAGAIGTGSVRAGRVTETTGTVLAAVRCARVIRQDAPPEVFAGPSFDPELYFEMSFSSTAANLLEHYRNSLPDRPDFSELMSLAEHATAGELRIEPLGEGEAIDRCFRHVTAQHSPGQVVRAILECVAAQLAGQIRSLCDREMPSRIASAGGGARSDLWLRIKQDMLGVPFRATVCEEPTSLGAAILAGSAVLGKSVPALAEEWVAFRE